MHTMIDGHFTSSGAILSMSAWISLIMALYECLGQFYNSSLCTLVDDIVYFRLCLFLTSARLCYDFGLVACSVFLSVCLTVRRITETQLSCMITLPEVCLMPRNKR